ncbi:hypothetical protein PAHAL_7G225100 [Panicum hallii]|uniref:Myb-like domain-containing protein n=1 Tax=Panicum hallii TaxID=206008 RepID=A0A2S3I8I4_9POAL|nr:uncharacterized protein LOC112901708 [Panicum hallii]PAN39168.1 hypothetical protein PAHAL_7G225100 [Panicum hallii]
MADDPNMNFGAFSQSLCNQHVVSFQTSATTSGSGGMPAYLDCSTGMDASVGMLSTTPSVVVSTGSSNMPADPGQNLKYGGPLAADWTHLELQILRDGLEKYVHEQGIMKYIKIAAALPNKTVRDIAMRCQWVGKKVNTRRRKAQEHHTGRNIKERKDKFVEPALWGANHPLQTGMRTNSFVPHNVQNNLFLSGASEIDRPVQHLLEENNQLLHQIETNILTFQAQNNIDLFHRARRNINDLLHITTQLPGMSTKMPPLRVSVNEGLASFVLPGISMDQILGSSHLKEEPRGW